MNTYPLFLNNFMPQRELDVVSCEAIITQAYFLGFDLSDRWDIFRDCNYFIWKKGGWQVPSRDTLCCGSLKTPTKPVTTGATTTSRDGCVRHGLDAPFSRRVNVPAAEDDRRPSIKQLNTMVLTANLISVIKKLAYKNKTIIIVLQETHCTTADKLVIPIFSLAGSILRRKQGLATFIHERLELSLIYQSPEQLETEWLCVDVAGYKIINLHPRNLHLRPSWHPWSTFSSNVQPTDLLMDYTAWRFWSIKQSSGCSTSDPRSSAAKNWLKRRRRSEYRDSHKATFQRISVVFVQRVLTAFWKNIGFRPSQHIWTNWLIGFLLKSCLIESRQSNSCFYNVVFLAGLSDECLLLSKSVMDSVPRSGDMLEINDLRQQHRENILKNVTAL